jgi:hypothetical protein
MDDFRPRDVIKCPVGGCPWDYELTRSRTEHRGDRMVLAVPAPVGVAPVEALAGMRAVRPVMAAAPAVRDLAGVVALVRRAELAQDDGVFGAHLRGHSTLQLQATFGDRLDQVLAILEAAAA